MKPLTRETQDVVDDLRQTKNAEELLHGKTPLTYTLGRAISRLCLLDVRYEKMVNDRELLTNDALREEVKRLEAELEAVGKQRRRQPTASPYDLSSLRRT